MHRSPLISRIKISLPSLPPFLWVNLFRKLDAIFFQLFKIIFWFSCSKNQLLLDIKWQLLLTKAGMMLSSYLVSLNVVVSQWKNGQTAQIFTFTFVNASSLLCSTGHIMDPLMSYFRHLTQSHTVLGAEGSFIYKLYFGFFFFFKLKPESLQGILSNVKYQYFIIYTGSSQFRLHVKITWRMLKKKKKILTLQTN